MDFHVWQGRRVLCLLVVMVLTGCGGGGGMISNMEGEVIRGELDISKYADASRSGEYTIGQGDEIDITFLYNPEYNVSELKVRPDGRISLPYAGEIAAAGMTPIQLDSIITERYSKIVKAPEVAVIMRNFAESVVYVLGEVVLPGAYEIDRKLTLLGAIAKSQGMTVKADRGSVLVIRRVSYDHIVGMQFDTKELLEEGRFDLNIELKPNDIVYVPKSTLHKAADFVEVVYSLIDKPSAIYLRGWQVSQVKWLYEYYRVTAQGR